MRALVVSLVRYMCSDMIVLCVDMCVLVVMDDSPYMCSVLIVTLRRYVCSGCDG
jgi:hypothetical protein